MESPADPRFVPPPPPGGFDLVRRPVPPSIARWVADAIHYRERAPGIFRQVETASLVVPLVISFGTPFSIALGREPDAADGFGSFTSGLFAGPVFIRSAGTAECVQVNFTPLGAWRFFGLPMSELAGAMVAVDDLGDAELRDLRRRLGELDSVEARLDLALRTVERRLLAAPEIDPAVEAAWQWLAARHGDIRIDRLAARLDWSRKHLAARFRAATGVPPKTLARIMRFGRAQALARSGEDWAGIAAACGYADQAHLAREFAELAGQTPTEWRLAA